MAVDAQGHDQAKRGIARVELWVDNVLVGTQSPPQPVAAYQGTLTWAASSPGSHVLLVRAYNVTGATSDPVVVSVLVAPAGATTAVAQPPTISVPGVIVSPPASSAIVPPLATQAPDTPVSSPAPPTPKPTTKPTPKPTNTKTVSAPTGKIAFPVLNDDGQHYDTWIVNVEDAPRSEGTDGTDAHLVVKKMRQPCLSPGGSKLAVNGESRYQDNLIVMNANGSDQREVSRHVEDGHPSWSPDGQRLVYDTTAAPGGGWQICIVEDLTTRSWHALPGLGGGIAGLRGQYPTWMPDGRIIFRTADYWATDTQGGLHIVGEDGGMPTRITSSKQDTAPDVHGNTVIFMSIRQGDDHEIFAASIAGGVDAGLKQLTSNGARDGLPAWSPNGKHIAFVSDEGGAWGLWVMNADGSGRRKLLNLPGTGILGGGWESERVSWAP
jgi:dipeptidyl aminopeptidase/acylaminoacyl peptidase